MKMHAPNFIMASLLVAASSLSLAAKDVPVVRMKDMLQMLEDSGYKVIYQIEAKQDVYTIEGMTPEGERFKMVVDPRSQAIPHPKWKMLTALDVAKELEKHGHADILKIELQDGKYAVKVCDTNKENKELHVHAVSGKISQ